MQEQNGVTALVRQAGMHICTGEHVFDSLCAVYNESDQCTICCNKCSNGCVHDMGCGE